MQGPGARDLEGGAVAVVWTVPRLHNTHAEAEPAAWLSRSGAGPSVGFAGPSEFEG
jgi:hypothetical protein